MRRYRISTDKVRKRLDGSFIYSLDDGDVTIACRDREVAIFQKRKCGSDAIRAAKVAAGNVR